MTSTSLSAILGTSSAILHFSGAVKGLPLPSFLRFNFTPPLLVFVFVLSSLRLFRGDLRMSGAASFYLTVLLLLATWLIIAAAWTAAGEPVHQKLLEITLISPLTCIIGYTIGADHLCFRKFSATVIVIGTLVAIWIPLGTSLKWAVLGGPITLDDIRIQYQISGLAIAAATLFTLINASFLKHKFSFFSFFLLLLLVQGLFLSGAKAAMLAFILSTVVITTIICIVTQTFRSIVWICLLLSLSASGQTIWHFLEPSSFSGLARFYPFIFDFNNIESFHIRAILWRIAISKASFFGLGPSGFSLAAGLGELRRWHPHNLLFESLIEGGVFGFLLFLLLIIFPFISLLYNRLRLSAAEFLSLLGLGVIGIIQLSTSTDLGNRMVWMWLSLLVGPSIRKDNHTHPQMPA